MLAWLKRSTSAADQRLGLAPAAGGCALVGAQGRGAALQLPLAELIATTPGGAVEPLRERVEALGLQGRSVNLLLGGTDYQLLLVERPEVPAAELRDAVRWRVRELVSAPLDSLVVDAFPLPGDAYRGRTPMAYCAVLAQTRMQALADWVAAAGLRLASIDIQEMALRNLGLLVSAEGQNLAVVMLGPRAGLICVQHGADLYMARRIERGLEHAAEDPASLALEIQRSLDYFESQLGKGYLSRLLLLPVGAIEEQALAELGGQLSVRVERLALEQLFPGSPLIDLPPAQRAALLPAIGAALRVEQAG